MLSSLHAHAFCLQCKRFVHQLHACRVNHCHNSTAFPLYLSFVSPFPHQVHVLLAGVGKIIRNCQAFQEWNYMCNNSQLLSNLTSFFASHKSDVYNVLNVFLQV